jgi:methylphosphotriester-DNA--protein-cysteine methyltransferase
MAPVSHPHAELLLPSPDSTGQRYHVTACSAHDLERVEWPDAIERIAHSGLRACKRCMIDHDLRALAVEAAAQVHRDSEGDR